MAPEPTLGRLACDVVVIATSRRRSMRYEKDILPPCPRLDREASSIGTAALHGTMPGRAAVVRRPGNRPVDGYPEPPFVSGY
jgi:hypothetical protein